MSVKRTVGIIYSPGSGAGWSTWGEPDSALDQELALAIDSGDMEGAKAIAEKNWPDQYTGGLKNCEVAYVDEGQCFRIEEYDGNESLILENDFLSAVPWSKPEGKCNE